MPQNYNTSDTTSVININDSILNGISRRYLSCFMKCRRMNTVFLHFSAFRYRIKTKKKNDNLINNVIPTTHAFSEGVSPMQNIMLFKMKNDHRQI